MSSVPGHDLDPVRRDGLAEQQRLLDAAEQEQREDDPADRAAPAEDRHAAEQHGGDDGELEATPTLAAAVELRSEMTTPASAATAPESTNSVSLIRLTRRPEKSAASSLAPIA